MSGSICSSCFALCCYSNLTFIRAELPDRSGAAALLLPMSKDSKTKEGVNHKLLNGHSGDSVADWVKKIDLFPLFYLFVICTDSSEHTASVNICVFLFQRPRTQINGKISEDGNVIHVEAVINSV